jgi:hypothetical protein
LKRKFELKWNFKETVCKLIVTQIERILQNHAMTKALIDLGIHAACVAAGPWYVVCTIVGKEIAGPIIELIKHHADPMTACNRYRYEYQILKY